MKVILVQDVDNLGEEGDVQDVADGYGRNYLIPKQLAVPFTKANQAVIESRRSAIEQRKEEKRKTALGLKQRLEEEELVLRRPAGDSGKLFGSVSSATVAEELERRGINIERKRIELPEKNIKMVGTYPVRIKLYDNEAAEIKIKIQPSEGEEGAAAEATPEATPVPEAAQEAVAEAAPTVEAEEGPADEKPAEDRATEEAVVEQAAVEETAEEVSVEAPEEGSEETPAEQIIAEAVTEEAAEEESVEETNEEE